jgi:hypothetical protein
LLLEIWTYSSFRSAAPPYASIRRAEVILWTGYRPGRPKPSHFCLR